MQLCSEPPQKRLVEITDFPPSVLSGTIWNLKGCFSSARQAEALSAVVATLSQCLSLDAGAVISDLWRAEASRLASNSTAEPNSAHTEEQPAGGAVEEEDMEEGDGEVKMNGKKKNGKQGKLDKDVSAFLPVSSEFLEDCK